MKIYQFDFEQMKKTMIKRLKSEFTIVKALDMNFIPKMYDLVEDATWCMGSGERRQVCFILEEYVQGITL